MKNRPSSPKFLLLGDVIRWQTRGDDQMFSYYIGSMSQAVKRQGPVRLSPSGAVLLGPSVGSSGTCSLACIHSKVPSVC